MLSKNTKILACAVVIEELRAQLPEDADTEVLDFGLHRSPEMLHNELQKMIDQSSDYQNIVLAFGLCGMAIIGLHSETSTIIIPKADDCIAIFMGSREKYLKQQQTYPGTLFLSKGWIEGRIDDTPSNTEVYQRLLERYDAKRARKMLEAYEKKPPLQHYSRMAFITTSAEADLDTYKEEARKRAETHGMEYMEVVGSTAYMEKIANGDWDENFIIAPPGHVITVDDFWGKSK